MKAVVRRSVSPEILKRCGAATFYLSNTTSKSRRSRPMKLTRCSVRGDAEAALNAGIMRGIREVVEDYPAGRHLLQPSNTFCRKG